MPLQPTCSLTITPHSRGCTTYIQTPAAGVIFHGKDPWMLTARGINAPWNGCHAGMFDFTCLLGESTVPRYLVSHSGCVHECVFLDEINIQMGGLWVKPMVLLGVGGPHPISGWPEKNKD